ncbi:MAG TPA: GatB/YqeY domain-containing protein [Candidatus Tidjanibacter faecipullorum]|uniref:GatB/YqeY domain-containing protein n=1 Tax=Candidatus Tidjanibacter faecipullorum TaxID=2838766 RepID=A0A9D2DEK6_9BACT|nr:GatB/YqeY domain-containing protein [Candidatus Tidjanibacter faecipullorum]
MTLEQRINEEIKQAMLAKEAQRLAALRAVKAAILLEKTSGAAHELTDADVVKIMQKLVKQRKESAQLYKEAGREELAANELAEAGFIEVFLPKQLSAEELKAKLTEIIAEVGAQSPADMGKVMGVATKRLAGLADGREISAAVKQLLSK